MEISTRIYTDQLTVTLHGPRTVWANLTGALQGGNCSFISGPCVPAHRCVATSRSFFLPLSFFLFFFSSLPFFTPFVTSTLALQPFATYFGRDAILGRETGLGAGSTIFRFLYRHKNEWVEGETRLNQCTVAFFERFKSYVTR